ncbi:type IV toxin-antitoxin system AbiEi family antitoxin domain-containing protein [Streptomyces sp. NPDC002044]|uniref:type IV toxin-antitoxin system AbiEi family antitoxin domain-containing protein n=1 Tax=Streptomyces sp. NPDC002044 TaxID=3154662 RepID=UPI00331C7446
MERSEAIKRLNAIAPDQWGLVTARQAQDAGLSRVDLTRLIDADLLQRAAHSVYQVPGGAPTSHLDIKAAWLRLDPAVLAWARSQDGPRAAVVSHASACQLYDIGDIPADHVEISVPVRRTTRETGVLLHKATVPAGDITIIDGLPVTTVDRTICDLLRARADGGHVGRVLADADQRGLTDTRELAERVQPYARAYGLPRASGADFLNFLAEEAGFTLRDEQLTTAGTRAISAYSENLFAHGAQIPGLAIALDAVRRAVDQAAANHSSQMHLDAIRAASAVAAYAADIDQKMAAAMTRGGAAEAALQALAHMTPQYRMDGMRAVVAQIAGVQSDVTAKLFGEAAAANSPARLVAAHTAELARAASTAARATQPALPAAEPGTTQSEPEDEEARHVTSTSE